MPVKKIFFDIDTQRDFMLPDGALYVPGAEELIPALLELKRYAIDHKILLFSSMDIHAEDDPEFCDFPPHCIKGTPGHEKIPETLAENRFLVGLEAIEEFDPLMYDQVIIQKAMHSIFTNPNTDMILNRLKPSAIYIYGVATEIGVKEAVLGALTRGYTVYVLQDAIKAVNPEDGERIIFEMKQRGASLIKGGDVLVEP